MHETITPAENAKKPQIATVSLIMGIVSIVLCLFVPVVGYIIAFFTSIATIVCSVMARRKIRDSGGELIGKGITTAAIVLAVITIILSVIDFIFMIILIPMGIIKIPHVR